MIAVICQVEKNNYTLTGEAYCEPLQEEDGSQLTDMVFHLPPDDISYLFDKNKSEFP